MIMIYRPKETTMSTTVTPAVSDPNPNPPATENPTPTVPTVPVPVSQVTADVGAAVQADTQAVESVGEQAMTDLHQLAAQIQSEWSQVGPATKQAISEVLRDAVILRGEGVAGLRKLLGV